MVSYLEKYRDMVSKNLQVARQRRSPEMDHQIEHVESTVQICDYFVVKSLFVLANIPANCGSIGQAIPFAVTWIPSCLGQGLLVGNSARLLICCSPWSDLSVVTPMKCSVIVVWPSRYYQLVIIYSVVLFPRSPGYVLCLGTADGLGSSGSEQWSGDPSASCASVVPIGSFDVPILWGLFTGSLAYCLFNIV